MDRLTTTKGVSREVLKRVLNKPLWISMVALAVLGFMGSGMRPASAQFASSTTTATGNPFTFNNSGSSSTFDATAVPVNFFYLIPNGTGLESTPIAATMTLTADVNGTASVSNIGGNNFDEQPLDNVTMSFLADSPINGKTDLLTVTSADATLVGQQGTKTLSLDSDSSPSGLNFSSNFLTFTPDSDDSFIVSFSDTNSALGLNRNGYLKTVDAGGGSGSFSGDTVPGVPEPSGLVTTAGLVLGLAFLCWLRLRRVRA